MARRPVNSREEKCRLKILAHNNCWTHSPLEMNKASRSANRGRAFVAAFTSVAFLWTLVLSVSPELHERIHPDANRTDHSCAVTFIASGNYNHSPSVPLVSAPAPLLQSSTIPALTPQWVESQFLLARIFEHAPPPLI